MSGQWLQEAIDNTFRSIINTLQTESVRTSRLTNQVRDLRNLFDQHVVPHIQTAAAAQLKTDETQSAVWLQEAVNHVFKLQEAQRRRRRDLEDGDEGHDGQRFRACERGSGGARTRAQRP